MDGEYNEIVPLYLFAFAQQELHLAKAPKSLDNFKGLRIISGGRTIANTMSRLGAAPISLNIAEAYEGLNRGVADGITMTWTGVEAYKLWEVTTYHVMTGFGSEPGMVFMAKKKFESLPAAAQKILTDNSGEAMSRKFGAYWDGRKATARDIAKKEGGVKQVMAEPSPAQLAAWHKLLDPVAEEWVKATPGGDKVMKTYRELLAQVKAGS